MVGIVKLALRPPYTWLAGLHAAAALYHHFRRRDTVLLFHVAGTVKHGTKSKG